MRPAPQCFCLKLPLLKIPCEWPSFKLPSRLSISAEGLFYGRKKSIGAALRRYLLREQIPICIQARALKKSLKKCAGDK